MPTRLGKKEIKEKCGVFGVFNHAKASELTYYGLRALQHRGQEGAGIVSSDGIVLHKQVGEGLVSNVFNTEDKINSLTGLNAIGHVRYKTFGGAGIENVQPFLFKHHTGDFALCHNGNLTNSELLKKDLEYKGHLFHSTSDSEIIAHLVKKGRDREEDRLQVIHHALNKLEGAFSFLLLTKHKLFAMRDKNGFRPLCYGKLDDGFVIASESCALDIVGAQYIDSVQPGEIIQFSDSGISKSSFATTSKLRICSMEYIYFSRPDTDLENINVHSFRKLSGKMLAKTHPAVGADVVIGVPDSSISAAIGFAEESNIPYEMGLVKNRYIGRTFIEPSQELRDKAVSLKLSAVRSLVNNKSVVLIDDSIVRGTTMKKIIKLLRKYGAKQVHVRIASPQLKHPCYYGVDISSHEELISHNNNVTAVAKIIDADSLAFLETKDMKEVISTFKKDGNNICTSCFDGEYLTKIPNDFHNAMLELEKKIIDNE
ncbi:MAG: amidophosphoribosyltransferase [Phycisphaerales bacterium]|nr:amidophosphoribosyltransferase [Phycisphaerales bacterium]